MPGDNSLAEVLAQGRSTTAKGTAPDHIEVGRSNRIRSSTGAEAWFEGDVVVVKQGDTEVRARVGANAVTLLCDGRIEARGNLALECASQVVCAAHVRTGISSDRVEVKANARLRINGGGSCEIKGGVIKAG